MRVIFLGSPDFAVPSLERLAAVPEIELAGVICQPDRPAGRGLEMRPPAVKRAAERLGLVIWQPERIRAEPSLAWLRERRPDALAVVAYGQILPPAVFTLPPLGAINAHASLLPRYRGAGPIQWAIARGETVTGVTTMQIDAGMDTGAMLLRRELAIAPAETAPELAGRLAALSAELLLETLLRRARGELAAQAQNEADATLAPLLKKSDGRVDWRLSAAEIYNRWRGFQPWPGIFFDFRGRTTRVLACAPAPAEFRPREGGPGTLALAQGALWAVCGVGALRLDRVQLEGRAPLSGPEFARGARLP